MYYIDTPSARVEAWDFDLSTGAISNPRPAVSGFDFATTGFPDGPGGPENAPLGLGACLWRSWGRFGGHRGPILGVGLEQNMGSVWGPVQFHMYSTGEHSQLFGQGPCTCICPGHFSFQMISLPASCGLFGFHGFTSCCWTVTAGSRFQDAEVCHRHCGPGLGRHFGLLAFLFFQSAKLNPGAFCFSSFMRGK